MKEIKKETLRSSTSTGLRKGGDKKDRSAGGSGRCSCRPAGTVEFQEGQKVELVIGGRTEIGYTALVNTSRRGLLYRNEVFQDLRRGQRMVGFIKKLRDDGKIDLCLQQPGAEKVDILAGRILDTLRSSGGFIAVTDRSRPDFIYGLFGASKKTYKKAIGALYRKRLIQIEGGGIRLANH